MDEADTPAKKTSLWLLRPVAWWVRVIAAVPLSWVAYKAGFLYTHKCSLGSKLFEANMPYVSAVVVTLIVVLIPRLTVGVLIAVIVICANGSLASMYSELIHK
jgi:hypothetical protein